MRESTRLGCPQCKNKNVVVTDVKISELSLLVGGISEFFNVIIVVITLKMIIVGVLYAIFGFIEILEDPWISCSS